MKKKTLLASLIVFLLLASVTIPIGKGLQPPLTPGILTIGTIGLPYRADPATAYDTASGELIMNVYEPLITFYRDASETDPTKQGKIDQFIPDLAESLPTKQEIILNLVSLTPVNQSDPVCTYWEDTSTGKWYHINGWRDNNPDHVLGPCDVIYMEEVDPITHVPIYCTRFAYHVEARTPPVDPIVNQIIIKRTWYIFKIRQGVPIQPWKYYNGTYAPAANLTTEDVEYSFERALVQDRLGGPTWMLYKPMLDIMNVDDGWNTSDINDLTDLANLIDCAFQQNGTHFFINVGIDFPETAWYQILAQTWGCVVPKGFAIDHGCWNGTFFNATGYPHWIYYRRWPTTTRSPLDSAPTTLAPAGYVGRVPPPGWTGSWAGHAESPPILCGTGPYTFTYLRPTATPPEWRIDSFNNYWRGWVPDSEHPYYVDTYISISRPEWSTRKAMFLAGDIDIIEVPRAYMTELLTDSNDPDSAPLPEIVCYKNLPLLSSDSLHFNFNTNSTGMHIHMQLAISDPGIDAFEAGLTLGRSPVPHSHAPPEPPYITHNDASLVSYDMYDVKCISPFLPQCPGGDWQLVGYVGAPSDCLAVIENAIITSPIEVLPPPSRQEYWKPGFPDYAPSGIPDFDQRQWGTYNWKDGEGNWSHCGPTAIANSLWWLDSEFETSITPPPAINDNFSLVSSHDPSWDDHDPQNVQPFIEHLAYLMDTDGRRTGLAHRGSNITDMQTGIAQYLSWTGVNPQGDCNGDGIVDMQDMWIVGNATVSEPGSQNWDMRADIWPSTTGWPNRSSADNKVDADDLALVVSNMGKNGTFYERTIAAPNFDLIRREVERCEDVVLTLGFWRFNSTTKEWDRENYPYQYGHSVTVAGYTCEDAPLIKGVPKPLFFSNVHARKAFAYALNFTALIQDAWYGEAEQPATWHISGLAPDYRDPSIVKYDENLIRVREELEAAIYNVTGTPESLWNSGFTVTLVYNTGNDQRKIACEMIEWAIEILNGYPFPHGVFKVNVVSVPWNTYLVMMESRNLPIFFSGWQSDFADADDWVRTYMHSDGYLAKIQGYSDATVDSEVDLAIKTSNGPARRDLYYDLQHTFINECPSVMIVQPLGRIWMRHWVQGWYYNPLHGCKSLFSDAQTCPFYDLWKGFKEDFNRDMVVDLLDLVKLAGKFGAQIGNPNSPPDPPYDPLYDLNGDGFIDLLDLVKCANMFGAGVP